MNTCNVLFPLNGRDKQNLGSEGIIWHRQWHGFLLFHVHSFTVDAQGPTKRCRPIPGCYPDQICGISASERPRFAGRTAATHSRRSSRLETGGPIFSCLAKTNRVVQFKFRPSDWPIFPSFLFFFFSCWAAHVHVPVWDSNSARGGYHQKSCVERQWRNRLDSHRDSLSSKGHACRSRRGFISIHQPFSVNFIWISNWTKIPKIFFEFLEDSVTLKLNFNKIICLNRFQTDLNTFKDFQCPRKVFRFVLNWFSTDLLFRSYLRKGHVCHVVGVFR